jgi:hypothetical protein
MCAMLKAPKSDLPLGRSERAIASPVVYAEIKAASEAFGRENMAPP